MEVPEYKALFTFDYATSGNPDLKLIIYDHCYGMTIEGPPDYFLLENTNEEIRFNMTKNSHYDWTTFEDPELWTQVPRDWTYTIFKHIKSDISNFKMSNLNYVRPKERVNPADPLYTPNTGCGDLHY